MKNINIILAFSLLVGCSSKRHLQKYVLPSESPCLDGTIINIDDAGCKSFFWGVRSDTIKIRCTMTDDQSWWVNTSFYFVPKQSDDSISDQWKEFCTDNEFNVYRGATLIKMGLVAPVEKEFDFRGSEYRIKKDEIVKN